MQNPLPIIGIAALLLAGCDESPNGAATTTLTADEAAQLNDAAEMLDVSNSRTPPSSIIAP